MPVEHPRQQAICDYLVTACEEFVASGQADPKFLSELKSGEEQKLWACLSEALVAKQLRDRTFGTRTKPGEGPDLLVMNGEQRVWVEVVCPEPVDLPADWINIEYGTASQVPHEKILLRWMSAIKAKAERLIGNPDGPKPGYLQSGLVGPGDGYVIAVNACRLRHGPWPGILGLSQFPYAAEAVFPIGPYGYQIDRTSLKVVDQGHQYRPFLRNRNDAEVPTLTFLDPRYAPISAIWALDVNGSIAIGNPEPVAVIHNPNAMNPVQCDFLPADSYYTAILDDGGFVLTKSVTDNP